MEKQNMPIGLLHNEEILWQGAPMKKKSAHGITVPLLVLMGIVALLGIYAAVRGEKGLVFFVCVPIILIGALYFAGSGFMKYQRNQIKFIITDMRIVRTEGVFMKKMRDMRFRQSREILLKFDKGNKTGTILFRLKDGERMAVGTSDIEFNDLKEVTAVYNLAQKQLSLYKERD